MIPLTMGMAGLASKTGRGGSARAICTLQRDARDKTRLGPSTCCSCVVTALARVCVLDLPTHRDVKPGFDF